MKYVFLTIISFFILTGCSHELDTEHYDPSFKKGISELEIYLIKPLDKDRDVIFRGQKILLTDEMSSKSKWYLNTGNILKSSFEDKGIATTVNVIENEIEALSVNNLKNEKNSLIINFYYPRSGDGKKTLEKYNIYAVLNAPKKDAPVWVAKGSVAIRSETYSDVPNMVVNSLENIGYL